MTYVVDANVHVISADRERYPVAPRRGAPPAWASGSAEDLLEHMRLAHVDQAVLVHSAAIYGDDHRYTLDSAKRFPDRFAALVGVDVAGAGAAAALRELVAEHHIGGIRLERPDSAPSADWLDGIETRVVLEEAAQQHLFVALPSVRKLESVPALRRLLDRFPTVPVLLRQLLGVPCEDGPPYAAASDVWRLAEFPNVYFSFSLHNVEAARHGNSTPRALFDAFVDRFGADRLMWGSFYPAHPGPPDAPYKGVVDQVHDELSFLPRSARDWMLGGTVRSLFPLLRGTHSPASRR
jgi:L-fuconolactonase